MPIIDAKCVTSTYIKRQQIIFDDNGIISEVGDLGFSPQEIDFFFPDEVLLFAGMGDVHIHAREDVSGKNNYKEDFFTAFEAMKNGGLSHAGDMPNNPIPPVDFNSYSSKQKLSHKAHHCIWFYAGIGPNTRPLNIKVPYKVYMGPSIGELYFKDIETLDETLSFYRGENVSFHCEDPAVLDEFKGSDTHFSRRPISAEVVATKDALILIEKYSLFGKLCHYSTGEGLRLIREARARGVNVEIEVTPQHLYFTEDTIPVERSKFFQMNPPIRHEEDRLKLLEALKNGEIQYLATDHAPHTLEEKNQGTSGLTGLDTYASFLTWLMEQGVSPQIIATVCSENPGRFFNRFLDSWKTIDPSFFKYGLGVGFLEPGHRANFTLINLSKPQKINSYFLKTKVQHSPFEGITFPGSLECLFIGGKKV
jgi:dihydroorotase